MRCACAVLLVNEDDKLVLVANGAVPTEAVQRSPMLQQLIEAASASTELPFSNASFLKWTQSVSGKLHCSSQLDVVDIMEVRAYTCQYFRSTIVTFSIWGRCCCVCMLIPCLLQLYDCRGPHIRLAVRVCLVSRCLHARQAPTRW